MPTIPPAALELEGPAPMLNMQVPVGPAVLELAGVAPAVAGSTSPILAPAPAVLLLTGGTPRTLSYANASATASRVTVTPLLTGTFGAADA